MRLPFFSAFLLALVLTAGTAVAASAQSATRSVDSPRFDVDVQVQQGGNLLVTETEQIAFHGGPFQQGSRQISLQDTEGIRDVQVAENGQPYRRGQNTPGTFSLSGPTTGSSGELQVTWWFTPTTNQTRTFVVTYTILGGVRFYEGGDQIRWNALPADRPYSIANSTVTLHLPADVPSGGWKLDAYPGKFVVQGSQNGSGATATWQAANLPPNQPFEVRAQWPHGLVTGSPPAWQQAADAADYRRETLGPVLNFAFGTAGVLILLFGGLWVMITWYSRGKDVPVGAVPNELDAPPSDLPPGLAGTLVDEGADVQDVIATVLDLAARHVIQINEVRDDNLAGSQRDFEITLLDKDTHRLRPFERRVLDTFFQHGSPVRLSQLGDWFHRAIPVIRDALHEDVVREGLFVENPDAVRRRYRRIGNGLMIGAVALGLAACGTVGSYAAATPWPFAALFIVGLIMRFTSRRMPKRTAAGAVEAARWKAYARHLQHAKPDAVERTARLREREGLGPGESRAEEFEQTLPYAVALGVERSWVQKFASIGVPAPRWLSPAGGPVIIGGPGWGGPWIGGPWIGGGGWGPGGNGRPGGPAGNGAPAPGGVQGWSNGSAGGLQGASGSLADLLQRVSDVLSKGGGGGWSGGGFGGGFSGGGGGGSGGGGSSFS